MGATIAHVPQSGHYDYSSHSGRFWGGIYTIVWRDYLSFSVMPLAGEWISIENYNDSNIKYFTESVGMYFLNSKVGLNLTGRNARTFSIDFFFTFIYKSQ